MYKQVLQWRVSAKTGTVRKRVGGKEVVILGCTYGKANKLGKRNRAVRYKGKKLPVSHLVWYAMYDRFPETHNKYGDKLRVSHNDFNPENNRGDNLRLLTYKEERKRMNLRFPRRHPEVSPEKKEKLRVLGKQRMDKVWACYRTHCVDSQC